MMLSYLKVASLYFNKFPHSIHHTAVEPALIKETFRILSAAHT